MVMVVECDSCHSRFRVKKSLLEGAFAIRFRCRTCDGFIVVRNPGMHKIGPVPSPTLPPAIVSPEVPAAPARDPEPEMPANAGKPSPPAALREPDVPAVGKKPAPQAPAGPQGTRLEDLIPFLPEGEVCTDRAKIDGAVAAKSVRAETRSATFRKRAWTVSLLTSLAGLGILLLASGAYYLWNSHPWGGSPGKKSSGPRSASAAPTPLKPAYVVQNLEWYIPREAIAGNLFVITGTVKNVGKGPSRGIRLRATLFGKDRKVLMEQTSIAGNYLDKGTLPYMARPAIEVHLAGRSGEGTGNRDIPPGNSLPFVVVCFDPPGNVETFKVIATDADL
jgi:predicted Zn finger-like uncharacterized protein